MSGNPTTHDSLEYERHDNKLLSAPPKKWQQCPSMQTQPVHTVYSPPKTTPHIPACGNASAFTKSPAISVTKHTTLNYVNIFSQIKTSFKKQNAVNVTFHHRIGQLELTTQSIDGKVDLLYQNLMNIPLKKSPRRPKV